MTNSVRRVLLVLVLVLLVPVIAAGCSSGPKHLAWDLRQPTTVRQLGGTNDIDITMQGGYRQLVDVDIQLPGVRVMGTYRLVSASALPLEVASTGPQPINNLQLLNVRVDSVDGLQGIVDRFDRDWGFNALGRSRVDAFILDARTKVAASGGIKDVDWPNGGLGGFGGNDHGVVHPALTVVVKEGEFSSYLSLNWTPSAT